MSATVVEKQGGEGPETPIVVADRKLHDALSRMWAEPAGFLGFFTHVGHRSIGKRYIVTALVFFLIGGVESALMRMQLGSPESTLLSPERYNQLFTMHGTTMMFLFAVPVMEGVAIYVVPLMIGTRNLAFPKLNALGYWFYLFGGVFLYVMFLLEMRPDVGWFAYVPLSLTEFSPGRGVDAWAQMITFTEFSALIFGVEMVVSILMMRAPGMTLNAIPIYVWSILVLAVMIIFAMPAVMLSSTMLILDRLVATQFFNTSDGGNTLLYQHLFWFFGHPEVYLIFLPATGFVSTIVGTFSRRPVFGYLALVLSLVATGFLAFGLWVHHMFATGIPQLGQSFFTAASMMVAIPSGVQIFCWLATIWSGRPRFASPFLFVCGFFVIFVLGGLSGVMLASVPFDLQAHDTYFVVAHFHYVLIGGGVFPLFGAIYYWFPKMFGRMLSERLGKWHFWLFFVGFNVTFGPMHVLGLNGMPRRVYTYPAGLGWELGNLISTIGAVMLVAGGIVFLVAVVRALRSREVAADNPWEASTLEWATSSPPPAYNFMFLPTVRGRDPLWRMRSSQPVVTGLRTTVREVLVTRVLDATPMHRTELPEASVWPFVMAVGVSIGFVGTVFSAWWFIPGAVLAALAMLGWWWPTIRESKFAHHDRKAG